MVFLTFINSILFVVCLTVGIVLKIRVRKITKELDGFGGIHEEGDVEGDVISKL